MNRHQTIGGIIAVIGLVIFLWMTYMQVEYEREQIRLNTESNSYARISACILSVPTEARTAEDIAKCYNEVESIDRPSVDEPSIDEYNKQ